MLGEATTSTRLQLGAAASVAALLCCAALVLLFPSAGHAAEKTSSLKPVERTDHALFFRVRGIKPDRVVAAEATLRRRDARHKVEHRLNAARVRRAAERKGLLRIHKPQAVRRGRLRIVLRQPDGPSTGGPATDCAFAGVPSCTLLAADDGSNPNATSLWGGPVSCADASRVQEVGGYRRLTVLDGDDFYGERCELSLNNRNDTFHVYNEGDRAITMMRVRLEDSFPLNTSEWTWQTVAQMKQVQPSDNGGGTPVLTLQADYGAWRLYQSDSSGPSSNTHQLWSTPAQQNVWTRIGFDVTYSQNPSIGRIKVYIDANGDGDALDPGEQSPVISTYTLKVETAGTDSDGISQGQSIPSHLRIGIYHDTALPCPPPAGCSADYDDIVVARPN